MPYYQLDAGHAHRIFDLICAIGVSNWDLEMLNNQVHRLPCNLGKLLCEPNILKRWGGLIKEIRQEQDYQRRFEWACDILGQFSPPSSVASSPVPILQVTSGNWHMSSDDEPDECDIHGDYFPCMYCGAWNTIKRYRVFHIGDFSFRACEKLWKSTEWVD
jgi:hypothetical protein